MKFNNHETQLLATEIREQLIKQIKPEVPAGLLAKIKAYKAEDERLNQIRVKAERAVEAHEMKWDDLFGNLRGVCASDSLPRITQKIKEAEYPTIGEIKNKITLRSLFAKPGGMDEFVQSVVAEFMKKNKKQKVVL